MAERSRSRRRSLGGWLLVLLLGLLAGSAVGGAYLWLHRRASVVLITIDTQRPDRIAAYGHPTNKTPAIDRLAREGMLFETAYCDMPWTTGSMSSVMTGQYSSSHGVDLPNVRLQPEAVTLAEILRERGYRTSAVVGSFPLDSVYGLDQGFETYDDEFSLPMIAVGGAETEHIPSEAPDAPDQEKGFGLRKLQNDACRPDEDVTDAAIASIEKLEAADSTGTGLRWIEDLLWGQPFFLWVHYFGPHEKLKGDVSLISQEPDIIAAYDGDVEKADHAVGRLLDKLRSLGILDTTLVILHADHGQNLGEFGVVGHGIRLDEATVRIPLLIRYPPLVPPALRRIDVAHNIDILPTVLAVVGAPPILSQGRSLLPARENPRGETSPPEQQTAYFETNLTTLIYPPLLVQAVPGYWAVLGPVRRSGLRTAQWRLVEDQVVGECAYGDKPERDPFGAWFFKEPKVLEESKCREINVTSLYPVSALGDREPDVVQAHPDVAAVLRGLLHAHGRQKAPLAAKFDLSPEQQEKLRSLGYLK